MKTKTKFIKNIALALCVLFNFSLAKAQFLNGDFQTPSGFGCDAGASWLIAPSPDYPQYVITGPNAWIDITPCGNFGNGSWIEQTINTVPGKLYYIKLDLGAHLGWQIWDAGVDILINGSPLNSGTTRLFNNTFGTTVGSINWKTLRSCTFIASGSTTTVKIIGNGANPLNPSYPSPNSPGVMGLDNVELVDADNLIALTAEASGDCNKICFTVNNLYSLEPPVISNVDWYVDNVFESGGTSTTYCRRLPKNVSKQIKAVVSFFDNCTTVTQTISMQYTATEDCPCDIQSHARLLATGLDCDSYHINLDLDPGYTSLFTHWTLDGQAVSGSALEVILHGLSPGSHVICANFIGGVDGEPDNVCCGRLCITIEVGEMSVTECSVELENCDQLNEFTGQLNCPDCLSTITNATLVGPLESLGYDPISGKRILRREYTDDINCKKCIVTFYINDVLSNPASKIIINTNGQPCITLQPHELPDCLRTSVVHIFLNGFPAPVTISPAGVPITLCCDNIHSITNPTYYLYAENDPCCFYIVTLNCDGSVVGRMTPQTNTSYTDITNDLRGVKLKLSPNPTSSVFSIESDAADMIYERVDIMDMTGRVILTKTGLTSSSQIDVSGFGKGTYFVNIKTQVGNTALKLVTTTD